MKKITVLIDKKILTFKYRVNKPVDTNLLNTNVINNNELVFSDEYLKENKKIVSLFINDVAKLYEIDEVVVSNNELAFLILNIISSIPTINCFKILQDENLPYELCDKIIKLKNIKSINCYGLPEFMIELLDNNGIKAESRNEVLFTSNFMAENNLTSFSKIYYKTNIRISSTLNNEDIEDIKSFCNVNKYLKIIHFEKYDLNNIKKISELLKENKKKNILIQIHDDLDNALDVNELKKINKELKSKKIKISLVYSKDYIERNYWQQIIFTTLKICAMIIGAIIIAILTYIVFNNYHSELKVNDIKKDIETVLDNPDNDEDEENNKVSTVNYTKLLEINPDTVGWLTVKDTKVDYPIVKDANNSFYLTHNFYQEDDFNGWIFMHYRNNSDRLDDNTIIFGHNRFTSEVMFGSLQKLRKQSWFDENPERQYITYNTLTEAHRWQIFSVYSIKVTSDYLLTTFLEDNERQKFFEMLSKRSQVKFDVEVTSKDKIITLSTCLDSDRRLVIHAVLRDE